MKSASFDHKVKNPIDNQKIFLPINHLLPVFCRKKKGEILVGDKLDEEV